MFGCVDDDLCVCFELVDLIFVCFFVVDGDDVCGMVVC